MSEFGPQYEPMQPITYEEPPVARQRSRFGRYGWKVVAPLAATALAAGAVSQVYDRLPNWPFLPDAVGTPNESEIRALQELLEPLETHCMTNGVWDFATTKAQTEVPLKEAGKYFGKGIVAETGKAIEKDCIHADGISYEEVIIDGEMYLNVVVEEESVVRDIKISNNDTRIIILPKPGTELVESLKSGGKAALELACKGLGQLLDKDSVTLGGKTLYCDDLNFITQTDKIDDAELDSAFREAIQNTIMVQGGQQSWKNVEPIFLDTFKKQAVREGIDPDLIIGMKVVDKNGNPIKGAPSFANKPEQDLIDRGFLSETLEGGPTLKFEKTVIDELPSKTETINE